MNDLSSLKAVDIVQKLSQNQITKEDVRGFFNKRITDLDPYIHSFVKVFTHLSPADTGLGIPIGIKDNICIKDEEITCASRILNGHRAVYDATVIGKLKQAGFLIMGTMNMDEFAFGSSTENSCYGPTRNPWDITRVPGGSSGGSAAAVAARLIPWALGSDTGGSIRQPASFCGVVGFKPTYGRVSRYGLIAFGSSLDQIGPLTTNFVDCAYLLNVICGHDPYDSTSAQVDVADFSKSLIDNVEGLKVGLPQEYFRQGLNSDIAKAIGEVAAVLKGRGAQITNISLPHTEYAVATYYIVGCSEASSNLQRFDGVKYGLRVKSSELLDMYKKTRGEGFGPESKRRIFLGTYSLSSGYYDAYYVRALKVRTLIKRDFEEAFKQVDVILTPTAPTCAFKIGEKAEDPLSMYLSDIYTISANLAGLPAVSFPCGFSKGSLPIGAQFIGRPFDEEILIRMGYTYQTVTDFHARIPLVTHG
ncbi:MAG: Asp-tRNA(Asn)/Glu-tRNA(Gln) amidotransferase subunit GatA [Candidatus Omnitrophica bacterium]|nr:Asp-tRNA(Asn)/Glu-tRNA(Gln) amidotransferase subunit GatA [Candidatus Omnitrophota bacterium]